MVTSSGMGYRSTIAFPLRFIGFNPKGNNSTFPLLVTNKSTACPNKLLLCMDCVGLEEGPTATTAVTSGGTVSTKGASPSKLVITRGQRIAEGPFHLKSYASLVVVPSVEIIPSTISSSTSFLKNHSLSQNYVKSVRESLVASQGF